MTSECHVNLSGCSCRKFNKKSGLTGSHHFNSFCVSTHTVYDD